MCNSAKSHESKENRMTKVIGIIIHVRQVMIFVGQTEKFTMIIDVISASPMLKCHDVIYHKPFFPLLDVVFNNIIRNNPAHSTSEKDMLHKGRKHVKGTVHVIDYVQKMVQYNIY